MNDRLRIASEQLAALNGLPETCGHNADRATWALRQADALLTAAGNDDACTINELNVALDKAEADIASLKASDPHELCRLEIASLQGEVDDLEACYVPALTDEQQDRVLRLISLDHASLESIDDAIRTVRRETERTVQKGLVVR